MGGEGKGAQPQPPAPWRKAVMLASAGTESIGVARSSSVGAPIAAAMSCRADGVEVVHVDRVLSDHAECLGGSDTTERVAQATASSPTACRRPPGTRRCLRGAGSPSPTAAANRARAAPPARPRTTRRSWRRSTRSAPCTHSAAVAPGRGASCSAVGRACLRRNPTARRARPPSTGTSCPASR